MGAFFWHYPGSGCARIGQPGAQHGAWFDNGDTRLFGLQVFEQRKREYGPGGTAADDHKVTRAVSLTSRAPLWQASLSRGWISMSSPFQAHHLLKIRFGVNERCPALLSTRSNFDISIIFILSFLYDYLPTHLPYTEGVVQYLTIPVRGGLFPSHRIHRDHHHISSAGYHRHQC